MRGLFNFNKMIILPSPLPSLWEKSNYLNNKKIIRRYGNHRIRRHGNHRPPRSRERERLRDRAQDDGGLWDRRSLRPRRNCWLPLDTFLSMSWVTSRRPIPQHRWARALAGGLGGGLGDGLAEKPCNPGVSAPRNGLITWWRYVAALWRSFFCFGKQTTKMQQKQILVFETI